MGNWAMRDGIKEMGNGVFGQRNLAESSILRGGTRGGEAGKKKALD